METGKIENVSRRWHLGRTHTVVPLKAEDEINVLALQKPILSMVYADYYAWVPYKYGEEEVLADASFLVTDVVPMTEIQGQHIYERVLLYANKE